MFASVLIEYEIKSLDHIFTYKIPSVLNNRLKKGMKVKVYFGTKLINGLVLDITNSYDEPYDLKEIVSICDEEICLSGELLDIGKYVSNTTLCTLVSAYKTMLPSSFKIKDIKHSYSKYKAFYSLNGNLYIDYIKTHPRALKQLELIEYLELVSEDDLHDFPSAIIKVLVDNKIITKELKQIYRLNNERFIKPDNLVLSTEQKFVFENIKKNINKYDTHLIYGVTASGKTEVYYRLIEEVLKLNKRALFLVPEITLTTQMINRFYDRFGNDVAVYHSGLSTGERNDEYLKILRNEVKIVVGTRSAVFAPIEDLGIIIIDEEHSDNFKQDTNPRYNACDVARFRAKYHNIPLILGSATPKLESMSRANMGIIKLYTMKNRINNAILPNVDLVYMADEIKKGNKIISEKLSNSIIDRLNKKEQVILLLNRRGFSPYITCSNCGYTYKCQNCDITLTYHKTSGNLRCHYCGYTVFEDDLCPQCHENSLNYLGYGTEKLESYIKELYPDAKVVRMDTDTTSKKGMHGKILNDFKEHKYDILIGTQMISKGLDFPLVTLVGVINADSSLNIPDFRSGERTFSLLDQVAGRAGRGQLKGDVIIQTFNPDNYILECAARHDYDAYYNYEMDIRKKLKYPPYCFITLLKVQSKKYEDASLNATKIFKYLKENLSKDTTILGPAPAVLFKMNNFYRFQIIIKYKNDKVLRSVLLDLDKLYKNNKDVFIEIDNNPSKM